MAHLVHQEKPRMRSHRFKYHTKVDDFSFCRFVYKRLLCNSIRQPKVYDILLSTKVNTFYVGHNYRDIHFDTVNRT